MTKFTIQPGTTYLTRDGQRVYVDAETDYPGHFKMRCIDERTGALTWRRRNGKFEGHRHLDLITITHSRVRYPR